MKFIFDLVKLTILLIVLSLIFHAVTFPLFITAGLRWALGTQVYVREVKMDFLNTQLLIKGLQIKNPSDFPDGTLLNISKLFIDFEIASLWEGKFDFDTVEIECPDIRILRREDGKLNLLALKPFEQPPATSSPLHINTLVLSLGYATLTDLSARTPYQRTYDLKVDHAVYRNVDALQNVLKILSDEILKRMGISGD